VRFGPWNARILRWIFRKWDGGHVLAQDRDNWQALVNALMNLWVLPIAESFLTS